MLKLKGLFMGAIIFCLPVYSFAFQPLFDTWISYQVGGYPSSVVMADLDADGDLDLAISNNYNPGFISILKNNGDGTFTSKVDYFAGISTSSVVAADLDADGDLDLAAANSSSLDNTVSVLKNNGDGTFAPKIDYPTGLMPGSVFAADLDNDGDQDLATANFGWPDSLASILKNNGDGTFSAHIDYKTGAKRPYSIHISDLNGDGYKDLLVATAEDILGYGDIYVGNVVSVFMNHGDGTFTSKVDYAAKGGQVIASDIDGDGDQDVITAGGSLLKNNGAGVFQTSETLSVSGEYVFSLDLDGDFDYDLAVVNRGGVSILFNDSNGHFTEMAHSTAGARSIFGGDLDGDSYPDLVVVYSEAFSILKNNGAGLFPAPRSYEAKEYPNSLCASDLDKDGDQDLAVATPGFGAGDRTFSILLNYGDGSFAPQVDYEAWQAPLTVFAADLDNDLDDDIVAANYWPLFRYDSLYFVISVLKNNGDGTFAPRVDYFAANNPVSCIASDLNGDGYADIAVVCAGSAAVSILMNKGDGTFYDKVDYPAGVSRLIVACDLDGDGDKDLAVSSDLRVNILKNNGDGTFAPKVEYGPHGGSITVSDVDGDGHLDLITSGDQYTGWEAAIYKNNGDGTFTIKPLGLSGSAVSAADFDGDGDLDLAFNRGLNTAAILTNHGDLNFTKTEFEYGASAQSTSMVAADFNGDGSTDLAIANYGGHSVSILKNLTQICSIKPGEVNRDGLYNLPDIISLVNIVFKGTALPDPPCRADATADSRSNLADIIYLVNKIFKGGPNPLPIGACCL